MSLCMFKIGCRERERRQLGIQRNDRASMCSEIAGVLRVAPIFQLDFLELPSMTRNGRKERQTKSKSTPPSAKPTVIQRPQQRTPSATNKTTTTQMIKMARVAPPSQSPRRPSHHHHHNDWPAASSWVRASCVR